MRSISAASLAVIPILLASCGNEPAGNRQSEAATASSPASAGWSSAAAKELRKAIEGRAAHALDRVSFDAVAEGDEALTRAALAYAGALAHGATDPKKLFDVYTVQRPNPDLKAGLAQALRQKRLGEWLAGLAPQDGAYQKLSRAYLALRQQPAQAAPAIPDGGEAIKPGSADPRVPMIARQLVVLDYLDRRRAAGNRYSPAMVAAVKTMQADYGIKPDGVIGSDALSILNLSDAERARAIAVNMERLRWQEREPPATRIDVNIAAARLSYWRDGELVEMRKVVVGEPDKETPQLGSPIFRLVANPTWTVPKSIEGKEFAGNGEAYLRANNMTWENGFLVQEAGPKNSLGLVKFDMLNDQAIYLHDTPAKALFGLVQRQRSHGCIRVDDALSFAALLAKDEGVLDQWNEARATGEETFVKLPRKIPVRLLYQTVLLDPDGQAVVRNDPYGWDDRVAQALGYPAVSGLRVRSGGEDVGP